VAQFKEHLPPGSELMIFAKIVFKKTMRLKSRPLKVDLAMLEHAMACFA